MLVIFTDLDGTLLDDDGYQFAPAGGGLHHVRQNQVPLVYVSSKTFQEQKAYQHEMELDEPMVVETGSAVVLPRGYFPDEVVEAALRDWEGPVDVQEVGERTVVVLGRPVAEVRAGLREVAEETGIELRGFGDMSLAELRERTGLPEAMAQRARAREYTETVVVDGDDEDRERVRQALERHGLAFHGSGPLATVVDARTDKGRAVRLLTDLYRRASGDEPETVAIGDGPSDVPMLRIVDRAFLVEQKGGGWLDVVVPGARKVEGVGPHGWERVVRDVLDAPVKQSRPRASIWGAEGEKDGT